MCFLIREWAAMTEVRVRGGHFRGSAILICEGLAALAGAGEREEDGYRQVVIVPGVEDSDVPSNANVLLAWSKIPMTQVT